jgi:hypothetical protein
MARLGPGGRRPVSIATLRVLRRAVSSHPSRQPNSHPLGHEGGNRTAAQLPGETEPISLLWRAIWLSRPEAGVMTQFGH